MLRADVEEHGPWPRSIRRRQLRLSAHRLRIGLRPLGRGLAVRLRAGLRAIAPVTAVRGNVDRAWVAAVPGTARVTLADSSIHLLHDLEGADLDPVAAGLDVVVCDHSHRPKIAPVDGVLYLNPGSAGPRRFHLPVALATLDLSTEALGPRLHPPPCSRP